MSAEVKLVQIYRCLCDETRLRLLHLLLQGPLCVCHFQTVLGEPQVKISKHLGYLKARGLVVAERRGNWMIYALPAERERPPELKANLACLQDCAAESAVFKRDLVRLKKLDLACAPGRAVRGPGPGCGCASGA
jgi:ArsR family transcriptional regulator, arsenate/arsenite/antimonite-responsive transcriptional repressor